ncbi:uncharacterized protein [Prorops nasuta]|uniref:uncharacterized protein n=1 Tax=Prorops nasuta TaxID=863751 RepID=UPI0034CDBCD5
MNKLFMLGLLVASALAVPTPDTISQSLDCLQREDELFSCILVKSANALERAARSADLQLIDGVTFIRETPMERSGKSLKTEVEIMNELPRDTSDRTIKLASMLYESAMSFFKSHSLKLSMPEEGSVSRALSEGRGKIKKVILPLIAAAGVKIFALVPILLGGLGLLVLKALFVGKIALLLAGVLAFQKLFGGSGVTASSIFGKNPQPSNGWYDPAPQAWAGGASGTGQSQGYYKRSFDIAASKSDAHNMAYAAQIPINEAA